MTNLAYFSFFIFIFFSKIHSHLKILIYLPHHPLPPLHFRDGMKTIRRRGGASAYPLACLLAMLGGREEEEGRGERRRRRREREKGLMERRYTSKGIRREGRGGVGKAQAKARDGRRESSKAQVKDAMGGERMRKRNKEQAKARDGRREEAREW